MIISFAADFYYATFDSTMDDVTKITLSERELEKVMDKEWILTKRTVIEKVYVLFGQEIPVIKSLFAAATITDKEIIYSTPKIYKGENYQAFPYVTLDYPAVFSKENIFAMRTMFWWGNFFSITLHLSGKYKNVFFEKIAQNLQKETGEFFICVNEDEWEHHFEPGNYLPVNAELIKHLQIKSFIKIALKYNLEHWNKMPQLLHEGYEKSLKLLND